MQNSGQNQGGHQGHDDRSGGGQDKERHDQKHVSQGEHHKNAHDKAEIKQKIEGAVAKERINEFKREFAKSQEGQPDASLPKKRRRRRRKKNAPQNEAKPELQKPTHQYNQFQQPRPQEVLPVSPFDYDQTVQESGDVPAFEDDEVKEEKADEPIFEDSDNVPQPDAQPIQEFVEPSQNIKSEEVPIVPAEAPWPEVAELKDEQPEPVAPIEPEEVPPVAPVAPVNPFDFGPEAYVEPTPAGVTPVEPALPPTTVQVEPVNPFDNGSHLYNEDKSAEPINPFDLTDSANNHRVTPVDQGVYEEAKSPEDIGESEENAGAEDDRNDDIERKPEVIEVKATEVKEKKIEPVFPDKIDQHVEPIDEGKDDFWLILEHAGITKNKLIMFGVILVAIIVVGLFFVFGGMSLFSSSSTSVPRVEVQQPVKRAIVTQDKAQSKPSPAAPNQQSSSSKGARPYDVISSYIFGIEYQRQNDQIQAQPINAIGSIGGVDAGLIFGKIVNLKQERFVEYVQLLEQMNNIYNVDIYALLNLSVDRRVALDKYLKDMNNLIDRGDTALATIQGDLVQFNTQYEATSKQANSYETTFFAQVKNYYGQSAFDNLQFFMDTSSEAVKTKAQYGAENVLKTMFVNSLAAMKPRYKDISTNTEALLKGVKVFDIKGSDINAIIPVQ